MGSSGHQVTLAYRDVPGLSWDVPHGILRTPSHTCIQGCPRTVLGRLLWDPPDTKSHQYLGMSQDCPRMSLVGSSGHQVTLAYSSWDPPDTKSHLHTGMSQDYPGMSLVGSSGRQVIPIFRDVGGLSWDVPCGILQTPSDHSLDIPLCPDCPGHPIMSGQSWDVSDICRQHWTSLGKSQPNLFELIHTFQQEEASTHMTILPLATGGRSRPRKKRCVEIDRRIETVMQRFKDSTISLTDYRMARKFRGVKLSRFGGHERFCGLIFEDRWFRIARATISPPIRCMHI